MSFNFSQENNTAQEQQETMGGDYRAEPRQPWGRQPHPNPVQNNIWGQQIGSNFQPGFPPNIPSFPNNYPPLGSGVFSQGHNNYSFVDNVNFRNLLNNIACNHNNLSYVLGSMDSLDSLENNIKGLEQQKANLEAHRRNLEAAKKQAIQDLKNKDKILSDLKNMSELSFISNGVRERIQGLMKTLCGPDGATEEGNGSDSAETSSHHPV